MKISIVHGPNLRLLGSREPAIYGATSLEEIERGLAQLGTELGVELEFFQSNSEGAILDYLEDSAGRVQGFVINPGGLTHTSVSLRDGLIATERPFVEVHLSNPDAREPFRRISLVGDVALGRVAGFGPASYELGLRGLLACLGPGEER